MLRKLDALVLDQGLAQYVVKFDNELALFSQLGRNKDMIWTVADLCSASESSLLVSNRWLCALSLSKTCCSASCRRL